MAGIVVVAAEKTDGRLYERKRVAGKAIIKGGCFLYGQLLNHIPMDDIRDGSD